MVETMVRELRMAVRAQWRDRGFALTVALTLVACTAANTLTFAVVNSVLLRPLPVPEAERIVLLANRYPKAGAGDMNQSAAGDYVDRQTAVPGLADQTLYRNRSYTLDVNGTAERMEGMTVTPEFFPLVKTTPALGRAFTAAEGEPGNDRKVILSHGLWQQMFAGRADVAGQTLRMDGRVYEIVGVMPAGFQFVSAKAKLWTPLALSAEERLAHHNNNYYNVGRLREGATIEQVQAQVDALNRANLDREPKLREVLITAGFHTKVEPLRHMMVKDVAGVLYLLWGAAVVVLLIGGLNVANLALARLATRRKELATRLALGATRGTLMRQSVVEGVLVTGVGGAVGVAGAYLLLPLLATVGIDQMPRAEEVRIDGFVALVSVAMACAVGVVMGLLPLTNLFPASLSDSLRDDNRTGTSGAGTRRVRQALVVAEVGFAFVLLVGAGLFLASFRNLLQVDPGFTRESVYTASLSIPAARYGTDAQVRTFTDRLLTGLRRVPGVAAVGLTTSIPLGDNFNDGVIFAEGYERKAGESVISPRNMRVTPGYFEAMGIRMVRGRAFEDRDDEKAERVVVIDERLAKRFWGDRDPVGQRMFTPDGTNDLTPTEKTQWMRVVGVTRSIRLASLGERESMGTYYKPYAQEPWRGFTVAVRTNPGAGDVTRAIRAEMAALDPEVALFDVQTMEERAELSLASQRTSMTLALAFGGLALFLSATGIYGVLAYLVTQRRREIGIRVALGSSRGQVVELVLRQGLALVGVGLGVGLAGAVAMQRAMASEVYGVEPLDPVVLAAVMGTLAAVGLAACVLPARRALGVDPVTVLHE